MPSFLEPHDYDDDLKSLDTIVDHLRALLKKAHANAAKERNRANDLEKKVKKLDKTQKLKRQPLIKHSKNQPNASDEALKAKDKDIEELRSSQKSLEKINAENKQTIDDLRKDVRELNLELATKNFTSENCENLEEIHKIYNSELKKLDEELQELRENEDLWKQWPEMKKAYEDKINDMNEQIAAQEEGTDECKERMEEYETEINRLNFELNKRKRPGNDDILFNGSAGLLMAGHGITQSDIDFIVQDNVEELRDSHAQHLGTIFPSKSGTIRQGNPMNREENSPFGKEDYIRELEELNRENVEEIEYLKSKIEENRYYEDGDILKEIEEMKSNHQEEVGRLNEEISMLRSCEDGDIWLEVDELKKEHEKEVDRLRREIEELKNLEGVDISEEVEELKGHHLQEVEALRKELETVQMNESGDIFEEVETLKKRQWDEVADLKKEIEFLKSQTPGYPAELSTLQEENDGEWWVLLNGKDREIELLKDEIEFLKVNGGKVGRLNENPEDASLLSNEINRLNGIIRLMSNNYVPDPERQNMENECPDSKPNPFLYVNVSQCVADKGLKALERVGDEATRAEIEKEYEEKMKSLEAEMLALKNMENEQIWKNAQEYIDAEVEEVKRDFLAMSNAKSADEWARSMELYGDIRRLKSELMAKDKKESVEIARLREEVRYLKQELSNLRKPDDLAEIVPNTEGERLHETNPFYETEEDQYSKSGAPSMIGDKDEEMWNVQVRPLLEDIANLNDQVKQVEEKRSTEKLKLEEEIEALKEENSKLKQISPDDTLESSIQQGLNKAYTDDEKLAQIIQELDHVQQLQVQADEKAADYERQLEEERSRHSEEMEKMDNDLRSLQDSIGELETAKAESSENRMEEIKNLKNELEDVRCQHEQEIQHIGEMCKEKTDALEEKISDLKISLGTRENELAKRTQEIEELMEKIEAFEREIDQLKAEIQNKTKETEEFEELIKTLRSEVEEFKREVKRILGEQEKTYALYQSELGRVHIDLLKTKGSHEETLKELEEAREQYAKDLVLQKEKLDEKFENSMRGLKSSHEDEIDQIRFEMMSDQYKFKEYIIKMRNEMLPTDSAESIGGAFSGLSRNSSLDSDGKKSQESRSKSDSEMFADEILFDEGGSFNVNQVDDGHYIQRPPYVSRRQSTEMTQSLDEHDDPGNPRKDEKKTKNKKKSNKSKRNSRDVGQNSDEENLDEVELKEKQKQCRQQ